VPIKLHIGCGDDIKPGFVNIDEFNPRAEQQIPIQAINYPHNTIDLIEGNMVIEHLPLNDVREFLSKAYKMLKTDGQLILEMPDVIKVCQLILVFANDPEYLENGAFGFRGLFGAPKPNMSVGDYHKWGYTPTTIKTLLVEAGFNRISISDGMSHCYPIRDMRVVALK
jgi:hypothetical protein